MVTAYKVKDGCRDTPKEVGRRQDDVRGGIAFGASRAREGQDSAPERGGDKLMTPPEFSRRTGRQV